MLYVFYQMCQALFVVLLLGWLFVPVYLTAGVSSIIVCDEASFIPLQFPVFSTHCVKCAAFR